MARCANGFAITLASDDDLAALVDATAPVITELREDPATARLIDEITALRDALPPMTDEPVACDTAPVTSNPTGDEEAAALNGVYNYVVTDEALIAAGVTDPNAIAENHGTFTWTLDDGAWHWEQVANNPINNPSDDGTYTVNGDEITFVYPGYPGDVFRFEQDTDGNLTLEPIDVAEPINEVLLASAVWTRTSNAPAATLSTVSEECSDGPTELEPPTETQAPADITQAPSTVTLAADYGFENSLASSLGAVPDLTEIGEGSIGFAEESVLGQMRSVLTFDRGSGLSLAPIAGVIDSKEYTIELLFRFDRLTGWRKILDFNKAAEDCGLYSLDGRLNFFPTALGVGAPIDADSYVHVVLTRDAAKRVVGYVNGVRQFSFDDTGELAVIDVNDTLLFFRDDSLTSGEYSSGAVARIRLYDGPISGDEVAALAAESSSAPPTVAKP